MYKSIIHNLIKRRRPTNPPRTLQKCQLENNIALCSALQCLAACILYDVRTDAMCVCVVLVFKQRGKNAMCVFLMTQTPLFSSFYPHGTEASASKAFLKKIYCTLA